MDALQNIVNLEKLYSRKLEVEKDLETLNKVLLVLNGGQVPDQVKHRGRKSNSSLSNGKTASYEIREFIRLHPGCSSGEIMSHIKTTHPSHGNSIVSATLFHDSENGLLKQKGEPRSHKYYFVRHPEKALQSLDRAKNNDRVHAFLKAHQQGCKLPEIVSTLQLGTNMVRHNISTLIKNGLAKRAGSGSATKYFPRF